MKTYLPASGPAMCVVQVDLQAESNRIVRWPVVGWCVETSEEETFVAPLTPGDELDEEDERYLLLLQMPDGVAVLPDCYLQFRCIGDAIAWGRAKLAHKDEGGL